MLAMLINTFRPQTYKLEGYLAFTGGQVVQNCPYPLGTKAHLEWNNGWWSAYRQDKLESQIAEYD